MAVKRFSIATVDHPDGAGSTEFSHAESSAAERFRTNPFWPPSCSLNLVPVWKKDQYGTGKPAVRTTQAKISIRPERHGAESGAAAKPEHARRQAFHACGSAIA